MKPLVYVVIFLLVVPAQSSLFGPISLYGIKPDLPLALVYIIGLLAGPIEGALAGIGIGLVQDISSAGPLGLDGFTRGMLGLFAGFLGRRVLDIANPANIIFLSALCLIEGIALALFIETVYGSCPCFSLIFTRMLPQALYTGLLGTLMLWFIKEKNVTATLLRRSLQKE